MAQIPLPTRQTVPNSMVGVKPPWALADQSGVQSFGANLERTAGITADRMIGIRAANEYHDFEGAVRAGEENLTNYVNKNPYATEQQLTQERDKYIKNINTSASKLTTNLARQWAQNSYLSQRDAITAHTDGVIQGVIRQQNLEKRNMIRDELIAAGDYQGLKDFWKDTVASDDTIQERTRTELSPQEEKEFQTWYKGIAEKTGINQDPDDPLHKYDYRGAYKAGKEPTISEADGKYHWSSEFKDDDHPNRFVDGIDTKTGRPEDLTKLSVPELQMRDDLNKALAVRQKAAVDFALQDAYVALYADGKSPEDNMGVAKKIITERTPATKWDTLFKDLEAEQKRYLDGNQRVRTENASTFVQNVRDYNAGTPMEKRPTWNDLNELKAKDLIDETGYQAGMDALNGKGTIFDLTDPRTEEEVLRKIGQGAISPEGVRAYHGKGLSTNAVKEYSKLAGAGKPDSYSELLLDDLKKQRDAGFFVWGANAASDDPVKPSEMDASSRIENMRIYNAVEKNFRTWLTKNPDATDAQKQEQYRILIEPSQKEVALGAWSRFWNWSHDEAEIRRRKQWEKLVTVKDTEEAAVKQMDPITKARWETYKKKGMTFKEFVDVYKEVNSGN